MTIEKKHKDYKYEQFLYVDGDDEYLVTVDKSFVQSQGYSMDIFKNANGIETLKDTFKDDLVEDGEGCFVFVPKENISIYKNEIEEEIERDLMERIDREIDRKHALKMQSVRPSIFKRVRCFVYSFAKN